MWFIKHSGGDNSPLAVGDPIDKDGKLMARRRLLTCVGARARTRAHIREQRAGILQSVVCKKNGNAVGRGGKRRVGKKEENKTKLRGPISMCRINAVYVCLYECIF